MNTATARRPSGQSSVQAEKKAMPLAKDAQLQALLRAGWEIDNEGATTIRLIKPGGKTMTHNRRMQTVKGKGAR